MFKSCGHELCWVALKKARSPARFSSCAVCFMLAGPWCTAEGRGEGSRAAVLTANYLPWTAPWMEALLGALVPGEGSTPFGLQKTSWPPRLCLPLTVRTQHLRRQHSHQDPGGNGFLRAASQPRAQAPFGAVRLCLWIRWTLKLFIQQD